MFGFEKREPGCIEAMQAAFNYILSTPQQCLTPGYLKNIHRRAAKACFFIEYRGWGDQYKVSANPGEFKPSKSGNITMGLDWITPRGFLQLSNYPGNSAYVSKNHFVIELNYPSQGYESAIHEIFQIYQTEVATCMPYYKLKAIVKLAQSLENLHAFKDGNTRTVMLILNRELVNHGFAPTMLDDPNRFDGHSCKEMVFEVLRGMENFMEFKQAGLPSGGLKI